MPFWKSEKISPAQVIILGFIGLILAGTVLLMLPISTKGPGGAPFLDALFTATSATCVTGLVMHDTFQYWTTFGQFVILTLIQIGGMGVVTMAVAITLVTGRKISLKQRYIMQESISAPQMGGIIRQTKFILLTAFGIEMAGMFFLALRFCPQFGLLKGLWYAFFHSISAFCNAGFDLMGVNEACSSLTSYVADPIINLTITSLIVLGGIGFLTWHDISRHKWHWKEYRLQTKLILTVTAGLLGFGFLYFFLYEFRLEPWGEMGLGKRALAAWFQSVSPRTAGFNTVDLTLLSEVGIFITIILMVIGGSTGSTAGGFKTTTLAVLVLGIRAVFDQREEGQCFGRRIPSSALRSAAALSFLYIALFVGGGLMISAIDEIPLLEALFETASAIGTVGLSLGCTPTLSAVSHYILIALMYFGRVGGLTMIYAVAGSPRMSQYPHERVTVG